MRALVVSNMFPSASSPSFGIFVKRITDQKVSNGIETKLMVRTVGSTGKLSGYVMFYWRTFWSVIFSKENIVYVHFVTHSAPPVLLGLLFRSMPLVVHVHGADVVPERGTSRLRNSVLNRITAFALKKANLVVAPSIYFKNLVIDRFHIKSEKIFVSPSGGVNLTEFQFSSPSQDSRRNILFLGRLIKGKGVQYILPVVSRIAKRNPDLTFNVTIAGGGPLEGLLHEQRLLVPSHVQVNICGAVKPEDVPKLIAQSHAMIFPSFREGESLGLVVLEAMACGRPVIAARNGAMSEIIVDGQNGVLFDVEDEYAMEMAIEKLLMCDMSVLVMYCNEARKTAEHYSGDLVGVRLGDELLKRFA